MNIPEEIKIKINEIVNDVSDPYVKQLCEAKLIQGYSLSLERMKEQEKEIEGLKVTIGSMEGLITTLENQAEQLKAENERLKEASKLYAEYIGFLNKSNEAPISIAYFRGWRCDEDDIMKGKEYREKINELLTPKKP